MNTSLSPSTLTWARAAASLSAAELADAVGATLEEVEHWEATGEIELDLVPKLAEKTRLPFGYLFLPDPPTTKLPISDFRRIADKEPPPPSRRLLSVLYRCQRRQRWYREYLIDNDAKPLPFVGSKTVKSSVMDVAKEISTTVRIGAKYNHGADTWEKTMAQSIENIESAGIIVSKIGYSDEYTHNTLSVEEFRGFALSDNYAPLVFVNGADALPAQMFTLAHEIVHIWLGESAVSNLNKTYSGTGEIERFCNSVAAEILVPMEELNREWNKSKPAGAEISRLSKEFRVSKIVIARRGRDSGFLSQRFYDRIYKAQLAVAAKKRGGGNYYDTKPYEASRRLSVAIINDIRNGRTMYREAMTLLGVGSMTILGRYAETLKLSL